MKRVWFVLMVAAVLPFCVLGQDFRNAKFGMTMAEVLASDTIELKASEPNILTGKYDLLGHDFNVVYSFKSDVFSSGYYMSDKTENGERLLALFKELSEGLFERYGKATKADLSWKSESYRIIYEKDSDKWGFCVEMGYMTPFAIWQFWDTTISLSIANVNGNIVAVGYTPTDDKKEKKKSKSGF